LIDLNNEVVANLLKVLLEFKRTTTLQPEVFAEFCNAIVSY